MHEFPFRSTQGLIMKPVRLLCFGILLTGLAFVMPSSTRAQKASEESDAFFKSPKVTRVDIEIGDKEMESLRREQRKYVKATIKVDGQVVGRDVGIHLKGAAGSLRAIDDKPGLTINMDKFVDGQRFHGMDKWHLSNSVQDPSYISEYICGELFRAAGVPASRVSFAIVTINGKKKGMYYLKEGYDNFFLKRHFGGDEGNFYDGGFLRDLDQPLQLVSGKDDVKEHKDLKALVAAAREPDVNTRYQKMEKLLEMDKFLAFCALEAIAWDWDGYPINRNNYRLYHNPKTDKITFIPSGMDQMFGDPRGPILPGFNGLVARAVIETPQGRKLYYEKMDEIMKKVFNVEQLLKKLDELEAVVQPALESVDAGQGKNYKGQVNRLRDAFKVRQKTVEEQLSKIKK